MTFGALKADLPGMTLLNPKRKKAKVQTENRLSDRVRPSQSIKSEGSDFSYLRKPSSMHVLPTPDILRPLQFSQGHSIRRINFEMYIRHPEGERYHTYSSLQSEIGSASRALNDICNWASNYPSLSSYYSNNQLPHEIILFESNLNLLDDLPAPKSKLDIDFTVDITGGAQYINWECRTSFYEMGELDANVSQCTSHVPLSSADDTRIKVWLRSRWWADKFIDITMSKLQVQREGNADEIKLELRRIQRRIRNLSVEQEIWATHQREGSLPQRIAILLWKFRQTSNHEAATTTWRKLTPPASKIKAEPYPEQELVTPHKEPSPAMSEDHLLSPRLDTLLYTEFFNPQPFFADESGFVLNGPEFESGSSTVTTVIDEQSLPSSTSTSFPDSVPGSALPREFYQTPDVVEQASVLDRQGDPSEQNEMHFNSQVSTCPSRYSQYHTSDSFCTDQISGLHASFESEDSTNHAQEPFREPQEVVHQPQGLACQEALPDYHEVALFYHQKVSDTDPPQLTPMEQDFAGMHIQPAYLRSHEGPPPAYDAPYNAGFINLLPLPRLLPAEPIDESRLADPQHPTYLHDHQHNSLNPNLDDLQQIDEQHDQCCQTPINLDQWQVQGPMFITNSNIPSTRELDMVENMVSQEEAVEKLAQWNGE